MHNICCAGPEPDSKESEKAAVAAAAAAYPGQTQTQIQRAIASQKWAAGAGTKKQFSRDGSAAITITCFVINYSLRNAGDRPKTTTITVTQSVSQTEAGRKPSSCWPCATDSAAAAAAAAADSLQQNPKKNKKRVHLIWRTNVSQKLLARPELD